MSTTTMRAQDGAQLHLYQWTPRGPVKAVVQIAHGMAEHAARYERFAQALADAGYAVYANDHRGHGKTAGSLDNVGYFGDSDGFGTVVADMMTVTTQARAEHPGVPVFLFGHSMGSMLARAYAIRDSASLSGLLLSGTGADPGALGKVGGVIASIEGRVRGRRHRSVLLDKMTFGKFNSEFSPARTNFDWLSRDEAEVDKYIADPYCGGVFTTGFFKDLLGGIATINDPVQVAKVRSTLPILLLSGDRDPVGDSGKGVESVARQFEAAGIKDVTVRLYREARHEILNETNRDEVTRDILSWLEAHRAG